MPSPSPIDRSDHRGRARTTPTHSRAATSGPGADRKQVYPGGYLARLVEAVGRDYPTVRNLLGEAAFEGLVVRYVMTYPPRSFDLVHAGDRLPGFLETDRLKEDLPFLPELARRERGGQDARSGGGARA